MKRELNSRSRRKWVAGGVLAFGSVALLSTGFATWVIGANNTYQDGQLNVIVDSAENNSFFFEFANSPTSDLTLNVREDNINLTYVKVAHDDSNTPMQITLANVKVTAGSQGGHPGALSFELIESSANQVTAANVKVSGLATTVATHVAGETYVAAPTTFTPTWGDPDDSTGVNVWTIASLPLTFTWGTFFGGNAPSGVYNTYLNGIATEGDRIVEEAKVADELNAMRTALTGGSLKLRVTVAQVNS